MKHTYSKIYKVIQWMFLSFSVLFAILGLVSFVGFISSLVSHNISLAITRFWGFVGLGVWSPFVFIFVSYLSSDISVNEDGLQTSFLFKKLTVNWDDVDKVYSLKPFVVRTRKRASIVVTQNGLTFFHRFYGLIYGRTNQPSLVISSNISDYDSLINKIKKRKKKK